MLLPAKIILACIVLLCFGVPLVMRRLRVLSIIILMLVFLVCFSGVVTSGRLAVSKSAPKQGDEARLPWVRGATETNSVATDFMLIVLLEFFTLSALALTPHVGRTSEGRKLPGGQHSQE